MFSPEFGLHITHQSPSHTHKHTLAPTHYYESGSSCCFYRRELPIVCLQAYYLYVSLLLTKEVDIWLLIADGLYGKGKSAVFGIAPSALNNTSFSSSWHSESREIDIYWFLTTERRRKWTFSWPLPIGRQRLQLLGFWCVISAWEIISKYKNTILRVLWNISQVQMCWYSSASLREF